MRLHPQCCPNGPRVFIFCPVEKYEQQKTAEIPKLLEEYITHLAKTGDTLFPWSKVRGVLRHKLEIVIAAFREVCPIENVPPCPNVEPFNYETMKDKILEQFDSFAYAPFTIQRLCELLCAPRKHYKRTDKFMRGIEKNLLVVSTVDPEQNRKRSRSTSLAQPLMNGIIEVHVGQNRASLMTFGKSNQATSPAPVDSVPAYDADSGISDTEDEDKLTDKPLETEASKEELPVAPSEPIVVKEDSDKMTEETSEAAPSENTTIPTTSAEEDTASKNLDVDVEDIAAKPTEEEPLESNAVATVIEVTPEVKEAPIDKKRPLEEDNDDETENNRDAKQPRFFSPDKSSEAQVSEAVTEESEAVAEVSEESKSTDDLPEEKATIAEAAAAEVTATATETESATEAETETEPATVN
uniref:EOG090X0BWU n=1 Tax=Evadne anonyx TaxID=141404 RepID=A0A9N6WS50_9CRUS|nr:EOG090X0BWU [Evadne anonyx]